jgi:hypothetical protein
VSWEFDDENPLVGLYGRQNESGITQLGFITLNTACQLAAEEVVKPADPVEPTEPTEKEETDTDPVVTPEELTGLDEVEPKEEESTVFGLGMVTFILICVGVVVFIGLIVTSVCTLRYKKNQQNRVASPVVSNKIVRKRDTNAPAELRPADTDIENNGTPAVGVDSGKKPMNDKTNGIDF